MKVTELLVALACLSLLSGCNKSEPVRVVALSWNVGEHLDCSYHLNNIYCFPPSMKRLDRFAFDGVKDTSGKPVSRTQMLLSYGPELAHYMERNREEVEKAWSAGTGTYETQFSTRPVPYSIWDCYRTGSGQPAIVCRLTQKPDGELQKWITEKEEQAKLDDMLVTLHKEDVIRRCGQPQTAANASADTLLYASSRPGISMKLWFPGLSDGVLESIETTDQKRPDGTYPPEFIIWMRNGDALDQIPAVLRELPCLKRQ